MSNNLQLSDNKMKKYFRNTLMVLLGAVMFCVTSCKEDKDDALKSNACDIIAFTTGQAWPIDGTDITKTFPSGTDVTALVPTITVSEGATVSPASGEAQDFSVAAGVVYTVTAADGTTTKTYTAKATVTSSELSDACDIVAFTAGGEKWEISGTNVTGTLPSGTDVTALKPTITVSAGARVTPASGVAQDFSSDDGVVYIVTAADQTTQKAYTAKAWVKPSGSTPSGVLADRTDWTAESRNGTHDWDDLGDCGPSTVTCNGNAGGEAFRVLDGNVWTGWHSKLARTEAPLPQCIAIDMQASKRVNGLVLHHRPDALASGHDSWIYFNTIRVYLSDNPYDPNAEDLEVAYGSGILEYTWDKALPVTINLPQPTDGRYLMLVFPDSRVAQHMSFTELDVYLEE
jgi:hypothetical protein